MRGEGESSVKKNELVCVARKNTWSRQRKRRRLKQRLEQQKLNQSGKIRYIPPLVCLIDGPSGCVKPCGTTFSPSDLRAIKC